MKNFQCFEFYIIVDYVNCEMVRCDSMFRAPVSHEYEHGQLNRWREFV